MRPAGISRPTTTSLPAVARRTAPAWRRGAPASGPRVDQPQRQPAARAARRERDEVARQRGPGGQQDHRRQPEAAGRHGDRGGRADHRARRHHGHDRAQQHAHAERRVADRGGIGPVERRAGSLRPVDRRREAHRSARLGDGDVRARRPRGDRRGENPRRMHQQAAHAGARSAGHRGEPGDRERPPVHRHDDPRPQPVDGDAPRGRGRGGRARASAPSPTPAAARRRAARARPCRRTGRCRRTRRPGCRPPPGRGPSRGPAARPSSAGRSGGRCAPRARRARAGRRRRAPRRAPAPPPRGRPWRDSQAPAPRGTTMRADGGRRRNEGRCRWSPCRWETSDEVDVGPVRPGGAGPTRRSGPTRPVSSGSVSTTRPPSSTRTVEWPRNRRARSRTSAVSRARASRLLRWGGCSCWAPSRRRSRARWRFGPCRGGRAWAARPPRANPGRAAR